MRSNNLKSRQCSFPDLTRIPIRNIKYHQKLLKISLPTLKPLVIPTKHSLNQHYAKINSTLLNKYILKTKPHLNPTPNLTPNSPQGPEPANCRGTPPAEWAIKCRKQPPIRCDEFQGPSPVNNHAPICRDRLIMERSALVEQNNNRDQRAERRENGRKEKYVLFSCFVFMSVWRTKEWYFTGCFLLWLSWDYALILSILKENFKLVFEVF